jgi:hypothetical protein
MGTWKDDNGSLPFDPLINDSKPVNDDDNYVTLNKLFKKL